MKKICTLALLVLSVFSFVETASAGAAKTDWIEPENYTDIRPGNWGTKSKYIQYVSEQLSTHIEALAARRPHTWNFQFYVTNLDLAGDTMRGGINQIRVIESHYIPRIEFSYVVTDQTGKIIYKGEESIKDMNFDTGINRYRNDAFKYEKQMIEDWFNSAFPLD